MSVVVWFLVLLAALLPLVSVSGPAHALPYAECCRLGNPGCCFFVLIELWWDGHIDFPGAGMT